MSSILDALDKLDTATTPVGGTLRSVHLPRRQRSLGAVVALTSAAAVAGAAIVGIASWSSSASRETAVPAPVQTAAVAPVEAVAPTPAAAVATTAPVAAVPPVARVAAVAPTALAAPVAPTAPVAARPLRTPAPVPAPRGSTAQHAAVAAPRAGVADDEVPWAEPAPTAEDPLSVELEREPMPRLAMARVAPRERVASGVDYPAPQRVAPLEPEEPIAAPPARSRPPAGAPSVRLSFLMYSSSPERRTVALKVGEGALASLHEGESVDGFQVVQIHRDHAELVFGGERFGLWPRN